MYLKRHTREKDGKRHEYYSIAESVRVGKKQVYQRRVLYLGELSSTQVDAWRRTIEVITEKGESRQMLLLATDHGEVPAHDDTVAEVELSSLCVRRPREFGACWLGHQLWQELRLDSFWKQALGSERGAIPWDKVVELLAVNRLVAPRSELYVHEKWFPSTGMTVLLGTDERVAEKDRLYRCLDRIVAHKEHLERHLAARWRDMFQAKVDILLYDITSTYFEGAADSTPKAKRGYSRDHRPDCKQITLALVVTTEGFPLTYEIFDGNRVDVTTLEEVVEAIERKHGKAGRVWVFDRGIVSEKNLEFLRARGAQYIVGTRRNMLERYEQALLDKSWQRISDEVEVKLLPAESGCEAFVLARSSNRRKKESAMRRRNIVALHKDLRALAGAVKNGRLVSRDKILEKIGVITERHRPLASFFRCAVSQDSHQPVFSWSFDWRAFLKVHRRDGAYLLRTNISDKDPQVLWKQYIQLTEVEACFKALKSELGIRPIWHWTEKRVEAHVMIAFLGYCLWVTLKRTLSARAPGLTPWQVLEHFRKILLVEVWFKLKNSGCICLERITQPEPAQKAILSQLKWKLPEQPPPKIFSDMIENVWQT